MPRTSRIPHVGVEGDAGEPPALFGVVAFRHRLCFSMTHRVRATVEVRASEPHAATLGRWSSAWRMASSGTRSPPARPLKYLS